MNLYVLVAICLALMALSHELGHYGVLKLYRVTGVKFINPLKIEYDAVLNDRKRNVMLLGGVVNGLFPLMILANYHWIYGAATLFTYVYGCVPDLKRVKWKLFIED